MVPLVRDEGHEVYTLTLTGLGERAHLTRPEVNLETHITDVVNVFEYEDLCNVVLLGHSYVGVVITGVADRIPDRLSQVVVYLASLQQGHWFGPLPMNLGPNQ